MGNTSLNKLSQSESDRLLSLKKYFLDDTMSDEALNAIALVASITCGTKISSVCILEESRQWFKAVVGMELNQIPRQFALCNYTILGNEPIVVENTTLDTRFSNNPYVVGDPNVMFYAAAPIITTQGDTLGTVCVLDIEPRKLSMDQITALTKLAELAAHTIETNINSQLFAVLNNKVNTLGSLLPICYKCKNIKTNLGDWELLENFMRREFGTELTHSICERCNTSVAD